MDAVIITRICFLITTAVFYTANVEASSDTYLGCYNEYTDESVFVIPSSNNFDGSTPTGCREGCRKDDIYSFAGLWGGSLCQCASGLNEGRIKPVNNSLCYSRCRAEPEEFCGGSNSNTSYTFSVYSVCPRGFYGRNCNDKCNCKDNKSCTVHGLCPGNECAAGWRLNDSIPNRATCSINVNVCETKCRPNLKNSINCHNCSSALHQECKNTESSFTCICKDGYRKTRNGTCSEIDECAVNAKNCEHACINMEGSYFCVCRPGYQLHYDRHSCVDVDECETPCSSLTTTKCFQCEQSYECQNTIGLFECRCKSGFVFNSEQETCEDIDECSQQMANCSHTCTNTNGGYECGCLEGFELKGDGHHCVVAESGFWSPLTIGLGLGNGVQFIIIVAFIIGCILLAGRNVKKLNKTGIEPDENSCSKLLASENYAALASSQATGSRMQTPNEYDRLSHPKSNGSRPLPPNAYASMHSPRATGFRPHPPSAPNGISNTGNHPEGFQEDAYFEIP